MTMIGPIDIYCLDKPSILSESKFRNRLTERALRKSNRQING